MEGIFRYHFALMEIVNRISRMSALSTKILSGNVKSALVCTMGAIHRGHNGLIQAARSIADVVVVSIFLNRLQFRSEEEYQNYPRDFMKDVDQLRQEDVDYVFVPPEEDIFPPNFSTFVEVQDFGRKLPGLPRETLFRGMTTAALKMIHIVRPVFMILGQKDALQGAILRKMIRDLNINTEVIVTPVVRDPSGLAYGTQNHFLTQPQREAAAVIYRSLQAVERAVAAGENHAKKLLQNINRVIETEPEVELEYAVITNPEDLEPLSKLHGTVLVGVGAKIGETSLNDSLIIEIPTK